MLPLGYWSNVSFQNSGTLENGSHTQEQKADDPFPRAPTEECLMNYTYHLLRNENRVILQHQLEVLVEKIRNEMLTAHPLKGIGIPEGVVCSMVTICKFLDVSDRTKFLALEIYDLFMTKMKEELQNYASQKRTDHMISIEKRVQELAFLRMGTCVQLASKSCTYGSPRKHVKICELGMALDQMSTRRYTRNAILNSEIRVLEMTGYNLNLVTALDVIEIILIQLGFDESQYRRIYVVANNALDFVYLKREEIFDNLFQLNQARMPRMRLDWRRFRATTRFNKFLEGCGVLATALVYCEFDNHPSYQTFADMITAQMGDGYAVLEFATVLASCIEKYRMALEPGQVFQLKLKQYAAINATKE